MKDDSGPHGEHAGSFAVALLIAVGAGFAGLVDEVVLARLMNLRLGTTSFASALVVSTFVLGWGTGAALVPRLRLSLGRLLILGQGVPGSLSLLAPIVIPGLGTGGALDYALLLFPLAQAIGMGMTMPLLLASLDPHRDSPRRMGTLQALNGLGSVLGALVCGYVLLAHFGIQGAAITASITHVVVAFGGAWSLGRLRTVEPELEREGREEGQLPAGNGRSGIWLAFLAGFSVVLLQLLGMRLLLLYFLGFGYVFAAVTAGALLSFSIGSVLLADARHEHTLRARRIAIALSLGAFALVLWPWIMRALPGTSGTFSSSATPFVRVLGILWHTIAFLGIPIAVTAALMPLAYASLSGSPRQRAARVLFWNGIGAALAPFLGALVLVPVLGVLATGGFLGACLLVTALALAVPSWTRRVQLGGFAVLACVLLSIVLVDVAHAWPWHWPWTSRSLYERSPVLRDHPELALRFADEDANFAVAVVDDARRAERTLFTDNFRAASTGDDYVYMQYLGTLPLHLQPKPERVLVIAFGTGTTAGMIARSEQVTELDIVEISQTVKDCRHEFAGLNAAVDEERPGRTLRWHIQDGRRFLETTDRKFQAITLEPLLPYAPVAVHFYTQEFHALCRRRLEPGGTLTHWIPATSVSAPETAALVRTFAKGFDHAGLFLFGTSLVLVGSDEPIAFAQGLDGVDRDVLIRESLSWITDRAGMMQIGGEQPELTDDWPWIEFLGPRSSADVLSYYHDNLQLVLPRLLVEGAPTPELAVQSIDPWPKRRAIVRDLLTICVLEERRKLERLAGRRPDLTEEQLFARYDAVARRDPDSPVVASAYRRYEYEVFLRGTRERFALMRRQGNADPATFETDLLPVQRVLEKRVLDLRPYRFEPHLYQGALLWFLAHSPGITLEVQARRKQRARFAWVCAAALFPDVFATEPYRSELQPLFESVNWEEFRRGAFAIQEDAKHLAVEVRRLPIPTTFEELLPGLRAMRDPDAEREWARSFRALAIDRLGWRARLRDASLTPTDARLVRDLLGAE